MPASIELNGNICKIVLTGKFDYSVHDDFQRVITDSLTGEDTREIHVDMSLVTFMDSSAISLLLQLNGKAIHQGKSLLLVNCNNNLREILAIGGFDSVLMIR